MSKRALAFGLLILAAILGMVLSQHGQYSQVAVDTETPQTEVGQIVEGYFVPDPTADNVAYSEPECGVDTHADISAADKEHIATLSWKDAVRTFGINGIRGCAPEQNSLLVSTDGKIIGKYHGRDDCSFWATTWAIRKVTAETGFDAIYVNLDSAWTKEYLSQNTDISSAVDDSPQLPNLCEVLLK